MTEITESEFRAVRDIMYARTGIQLNDSKRALVCNRLRKRLLVTNKNSYADYIRLLGEKSSAEMEAFVNAITTNETFFFRHDDQFSFLINRILPELINKRQAQGRHELNIWSAACSTGEEPYTLAILLEDFFARKPGWTFRIHATDINTDVLAHAMTGRFTDRSLQLVKKKPEMRWFTPVADKPGFYTLAHEIRRHVKFRAHNLMEPPPFKNIDLLFVRNVMIYFDKASKQTAVSHLASALEEDGYFFISLAETLNDVKTELEYIKSGVYAHGGKMLRENFND